MADNVRISTADGVLSFATDEVNGLHYFREKPVFGADGSVDGDVQLASTTVLGPLPVNNYHASDFMMVAGLGVTPKFAKISITTTGTIVAAVTEKIIRVLSCLMTIDVLTGDETYTFKSGAAGTALTGDMGDASGADTVRVINYPFSPIGHFQTTSGVLLELSLAQTASAQGSLVYIEV